MNQENKTTMSVVEMGQILGLSKTEAYWLVHKKYFETTLVQGIMRVNIESFERWYQNQDHYQKITEKPSRLQAEPETVGDEQRNALRLGLVAVPPGGGFQKGGKLNGIPGPAG